MPISDTQVSANFEGLARLVGLTTPTSSRAPRDMAVLQTDDVGRITMMNAQAQALLKPEGATTGSALVRVFSKELPRASSLTPPKSARLRPGEVFS